MTLLLAGIAGAQENPNLRYYYPVPPANPAQVIEADLVVYGGTPGGVTAAIQAGRMGKRAVLFSFNTFVGGLTSGGLTATDVGNRGRDRRDGQGVLSARRPAAGFKPSEAERAYLDMLKEANVPVYFEHRLSA